MTKELRAANQKFPEFRSPHEGFAVILEEQEELDHEATMLESCVNYLWCNVKGNYPDDCELNCTEIYERAINAAVEAIQVAAMAEKFVDSMKGIKHVQS